MFPVTGSGLQDFLVRPASDGVRIFYVSRAGNHYDLMQASVHGGEEHQVTAPFQNTNTVIWDVSPDGSRYLIGTFISAGDPSQLWSWPATGGVPTKLGDLVSGNAAYSPDGLRIAFHIDRELWVADVDGTGKRRMRSFASDVDAPAWVPGGSRIRFTLAADGKRPSSIWEIDAEGAGLRQILPGWNNGEGIRCGGWMPDGRNYVFVEMATKRLWTLPERRKWWRRASAGPFPLPTLPDWAWSPLAGRDGRHIFFWGGGAARADLQLLDPRTHALSPFLPGHWVGMPSFSRDFGQVAFSEHDKLWRIRANGEDVQLIALPGLKAFFPRWSPDGRTLIFIGDDQVGKHDVYTIAADGGVATPVLPGVSGLGDPDWSPDGSQIVVIRHLHARHVLALISTRARRQLTDIPNSENLIFPRWSPAGRFLAATAADRHEIRLYDFVRRTWRVVARGNGLGQSMWSADGAGLFFQEEGAVGVPVSVFYPQSGVTRLVARFDKVLNAGNFDCRLVTVARGDMPVIEVGRSSANLYGAEIEFP